MGKRLISFVVAVMLLLTLIPDVALTAYAANTYSINGVNVRYDNFSSSPGECWVYANNFYNKIWGSKFTNSFSDTNNSLRNLSDSELLLTADHLEKYVTNAALGSCIRITSSSYLHVNKDSVGHSQIIVQKDSQGFTVFEGGLSASPYCREKYYTWSGYVSKWKDDNHKYIKYIKWPGAAAYTGVVYSTFDVNGYLDGDSRGDLSNYGTFDVWMNGTLVADNVNDYCVDWPVGTNYEITDIRATEIHKYLGVGAGALSGTIGVGRTDVSLQFRTLDNIGDDFYAYIINKENGSYAHNQGDNNVTAPLYIVDNELEQIWHFQRLEDGTYKITSVWNGRSMDVQGYGTTSGTNLISMPYVGNDAQRWCIFEEAAGCKLSAVCTPCVVAVNTASGNIQMEHERNEDFTQWFTIEKIPSEYYLDVNGFIDGQELGNIGDCGTFEVWVNGSLVAGNVNDYCDDKTVGSSYEITNIQVSGTHKYLGLREGSLSGTIKTGTNDVWLQFRTIDNIGDDFYAYIISNMNGNYVYNQGDHNVTVLPYKENLEAVWHFQRLEDGTYKITSAWDGYSLDVLNYGTTPGTNVHAYPYEGNTAQRWCIFQEDTGCKLSAVCTPCAMAVKASTGINVQMENECNEDLAQWFQIVPVAESYSWDVSGFIDGKETAGIDGYGTFDIWLDGVQVADDVVDYFAGDLKIGTKYEIRDIRVKDGKAYNGVHSGSLSGTIGPDHCFTLLDFSNAQTGDVGEPAGEATLNGHKYVYYPGKVSWYTAKAFCEEQGGHLVTLTSAEEEELVQTLCGGSDVWLGGTDTESEGNWVWITGEPFEYSNWGPGQPDNAEENNERNENYLMIWNNKWNDIYGSDVYGFVCEIEQGELKLGGYMDGQLQDSISGYGTVDVYIDGALVADDVSDYSAYVPGDGAYKICDIKPAEGYSYNGVHAGAHTGTVDWKTVSVVLEFTTIQTDHIGEPDSVIEWNGKTYAYYSEPVTWYTANAFCNNAGGHLVTITDSQENDLVYSMIGENRAWTGGTDAESEQQWQWITGEEFEYQAWRQDSNEPNNAPSKYDADENYLAVEAAQWNDKYGCDKVGFILEIEPGIFELNGYLDGQPQASIADYGTVDVYVDGTLVADDVSEYSASLTGGSTYEICDVKPADGYSYNGIYAGERTGTIKGNDIALVLEFTTVQTENIGEAASVIEWNGKTYAYYTEPVTWYSAKTICEKLGGHLVTINSEAENNLVQILCEGTSVWAGGTDSAQEQEWRWVTDETFEYELWLSGEPNNVKNDDEDGEDFISLTSGGWNDVEGCRGLPFVCEFEEKTDDDLEPVIPTLTLKSPTLEFKDMICINAFYTAENTEDVVEMGMITYNEKVSEWSVETADYVIPGATYVESSGRYYSSSQGIHAKYLADTVYLACYAKLTNGRYVYSKLAPYSPIQYANSQLKNSTDVKLKQLVVAMLNYGAEAQRYFGHNVESLANSTLTADQLALPESYRQDMVQTVPAASAGKQGIFANNQGFASRKPAISFEGAFCINYFFTPKYEPVQGITLYYWNETDFNAVNVLTTENATGILELDGTGLGQYRGDITGIAAKSLSQAVYVAAVYSDGTTTWTSGVLGYSIGTYCSGQASKDGDIANLAKATAVYGYCAKQYFG